MFGLRDWEMPDNGRGHRSLGAADVAKAALLAVLLLTPVLVGVSMLGVSVAQPKYSAWLKLVTDSWEGTPDTTLPGDTPVMPAGVGFADRYNVTNACVEVYRLKSFGGHDFAGTFYPNGTGFVRIEWPTGWENVTVIVKAKSYQGQCIGTVGNPYSGIIIYWLTVNPTDSFRTQFGVGAGNVTVGDDGIEVPHGDFDWDISAPFGSGPVDIVNYTSGPVTFKINHEDARNAWVARAAYIFKLFHEHTWYSVNDVLTYAIITIYDVDHTAASSPHSLLQAAITGSDGQSRYTREIYPASQGVGGGRFANNKLVPIPLQVINLGAKMPFEGGIGAPQTGDPVDAPHLNVTKRVWWETVLVNQTFYVGNEYNGTGGYDGTVVAGKYVPLFGAFAANPTLSPTVTQGGITGVPAGPMSLVLNHTVPGIAEGLEDWELPEEGIIGVANLDNNTVFYARFCVQDADLSIQHPEVGDKMVGAEVTINFKTATDRPYYLSHNILTTDSSGCTATPHKWPGYLDEFSKFARFPNGTNWGLRGSLNVSKHFNPADDASPAWRPGGYFERAWGGDWRGPYNNAGKNWSALIPEITYMKTRQLSDDKNWDGFDVQVKWKGGSRNSYGGEAVLVDSVRVKNPYAIALLYSYADEDIFGGWVFPYTELANNKFWLKIHKAASVDIDGDTIVDPIPTLLEIMGPFSLTLTNFDSTTGTFDVTITANGPLVVNNATDPESVVDWTLTSGEDIIIEDALVSFKKHDITEFFIAFEAGQGQADRGADGSDDYTSVDEVFVSGGPFEVEFWPGPPGSGTVRALISGHDVDVCILPNNLNTCPNIMDFTGALLVKGPPRIVEFLVYLAGDGSVSGNYETRAGPISYTYTTAAIDLESSVSPLQPFVYEILEQLGQGGFITVPVSGTALIDIDGDLATDDLVEIDGTVTVSVGALPLHYAWLWTQSNAFTIFDAETTLSIDLNNDGVDDVTDTCTDYLTLGDIATDVTTYHDPDTGLVTIIATAPVTVQCIAENIDLDEDTDYDDSYTVTLSATMTIVGQQQLYPSWNNLWLPIDWTGGSISVSGPLEIDINSDGVDFTIPVSGNRPGSTLTDLPFEEVLPIDSDSYTNTGTLTCTISGTVPATGVSPGTMTCTGTLSFTIDIDSDSTPDVVFTGLPLSGSGDITTSHDGLGNVLIWGSISVAAPLVIGDLDNDGSSDDTLQITKTVDVNIVGTITFPPGNQISVDSGGISVVGADIIDISTNDEIAPPDDIVADETGTLDLEDEIIDLTVPSVVSGIFQSGQIFEGGLFFADTASEQVFVYGELDIGSVTQTGELPPQGTVIYLELYGVGSIDNANGLEASGWAFMRAAPIALYETGVDAEIVVDRVIVEGVFTLFCEPVGEFFAGCSLTVDFDGQTTELGAPFSGTLVINDFTIFGVFGGSMFASLEEEEELEISGDTPEDYNLAIGETEYTSDSLTLNGGILSVGPIVKAKLDNAFFAFGHELALSSLFEDMTLGGTAIDTTIFGDNETITVDGEQSFSISLTNYPTIDITSFVVPLPDLSADNEDLDNRLFGGYDDFALTGTGIVYITAWVHDIAYKIVDNMGNTLPSSDIAVTLIRPNGNPVTRSDQINWDQLQGNLAWSYSQWAGADTGYAIFYQLPGDQAYGLTVSFRGQVVHEEQFQIEKLTETVIDTIVVNVVKLKIVIVDCNGETLD
ncbi:MAG: hypothetical protein QXP49_02180, partial [Nitrososphaerota archaeon]